MKNVGTGPIVAKAPILLAALCFGVMIVLNFRRSPFEQVFIFSYYRFALLALLLILFSYLVFSLVHPRLSTINNYVIYLIVICAFAAEAILRVSPGLINDHYLKYFSKEARQKIIESRGFYNMRIGEGMVYYFKPFTRLKNYPHVQIDSQGFRNTEEKRREHYDIVLLGDSQIFSLDAEKDLGALLNERNLSVLNLAMGGYSPQHYRDVYNKFIMKKGIKNKLTLIFLFIGNDFGDAQKYRNVVVAGDGYKQYSGYVASEEKGGSKIQFSWVISCVRGAMYHYIEKRSLKEISVESPQGRVKVRNLWWPPAITPEDERWMLTKTSLDELVRFSRHNDSEPVLLLFPSPATYYSQYEPGFGKWDRHHEATSNMLKDYSSDTSILYFDLNKPLRQVFKNEGILVSPSDCHLNSKGIEQLSRIVYNFLREHELLPEEAGKKPVTAKL